MVFDQDFKLCLKNSMIYNWDYLKYIKYDGIQMVSKWNCLRYIKIWWYSNANGLFWIS